MTQKIVRAFNIVGFNFGVRITRLIAGEERKTQLQEILKGFGLPVFALVIFMFLWEGLARQVDTSLGRLPGPVGVFQQARALVNEHKAERAKEVAFYHRQEVRNEKILKEHPHANVRIRTYTGKPTYIDQIYTSLITVFTGFLLASLIAIPLGILCGISPLIMSALNPLIQIFKPVSPLAWLPIVTMVVSAVYITKDGMFEKSFLNSAITVALCSLWPSLINTATAVSSIDRDYVNVGKVLKLGFFSRIFKIVMPASLPLVFTGLRISLGVGWMVLIAAEMLAQNPGLGKFVWDEFQNGSSQSLARIMVAVFTIGIIGALLDKMMTSLQRLVSFNQDIATI